MNEMTDTASSPSSFGSTLPGNEVPPNPGAPSGTPTLSYVPAGRVLQRKNGKIAGVAGGLADYFNLDVTIVRLAIVFLTILTAPAMPLAYLLAWIVIPEEDTTQTAAATPTTAAPAPPAPPAPEDATESTTSVA